MKFGLAPNWGLNIRFIELVNVFWSLYFDQQKAEVHQGLCCYEGIDWDLSVASSIGFNKQLAFFFTLHAPNTVLQSTVGLVYIDLYFGFVLWD